MSRNDDYCGTRALVLGASGFIGRWVVAELIRRGAEVHAAVRDPETARHGLRPWRVEPVFHRFEARIQGGLEALVDETVPDLVFNLAGYGVDPRERDPHEARRINVDLVLRLAETLNTGPTRESDWSGQRLVHVGSAAEYGAVQGDLSESGPCAPQGLYGETKLAGTLGLGDVARASGLAGLTARLFTVYGAGERPGRLFPSLIRLAQEGGVLELTDGRQVRDFTAVDQVARALVDLARAPAEPGSVVNVASGTLNSVRSFSERIASALEIESDRLIFGAREARDGEMSHDAVTNERLRGLGVSPPDDDLEGGLKRSLEWLPRMRHDD